MVAPTVCNVGAEDHFGPWADVVIRPYGADEEFVRGAAPYIFYFCIAKKKRGILPLDEPPKVSLHRDGGHAQPQDSSSSVSPVRCEQRAQRVKEPKEILDSSPT